MSADCWKVPGLLSSVLDADLARSGLHKVGDRGEKYLYLIKGVDDASKAGITGDLFARILMLQKPEPRPRWPTALVEARVYGAENAAWIEDALKKMFAAAVVPQCSGKGFTDWYFLPADRLSAAISTLENIYDRPRRLLWQGRISIPLDFEGHEARKREDEECAEKIWDVMVGFGPGLRPLRPIGLVDLITPEGRMRAARSLGIEWDEARLPPGLVA